MVNVARVIMVVFALLCGHLLLARAPILPAYAASGNDEMTITLADKLPVEGYRHQLDNIEAYCLNKNKKNPAVDFRVYTWKSGRYALDYALYHSEGSPAGNINWEMCMRIVWILADPDLAGFSITGGVITDLLSRHDTYEESKAFLDACLAFERSGAKGPERGTSRMYDPPTSIYQGLAIARTGTIQLSKQSTIPDVVDGSRFSLAGAEYAIYRDPECTIEVEGARMVTDASGHATSVELGAAATTTYYVRELTPSPGFALDTEVHAAEVSSASPATVVSYEEPLIGKIRLTKLSEGTADVTTNASYSLAGAVYGVYPSSACSPSSELATFATDEDGHAIVAIFEPGTYWVKEMTPSPGHALDANPYRVEVGSNDTAYVTSTDRQLMGRVELTKASAVSSLTDTCPLYDLGGAQYGIYADESCGDLVQTLTLARSVDGTTSFARSDELSAGDYWVREIAAPTGYLPDEATYPVTVEPSGTTPVNIDAGGRVLELPAACPELSLVLKADAELAQTAAAEDEGTAIGPDADGHGIDAYETGNIEGAGNSGTSSGDEDTDNLGTSEDGTNEGEGGAGESADGTNEGEGLSGAQGAATLADAIFEVRYYDAYLDDVDTLPSPTRRWTFRSDVEGRVVFDGAHLMDGDELFRGADGEAALPLGSYAIQELQAPTGYWLEGQDHADETYVAPVHLSQVRPDPQAQGGASIVDLSWEGAAPLQHASFGQRMVLDQVKRYDVKAIKVQSDTQERLASIPFVLVSETTGEWHVLVSDSEGKLDSSAAHASRLAENVNANDAAVSREEDGSFVLVDASLLGDQAGIWFGGSTAQGVAPSDEYGALPYDRYRLVEVLMSAEDAALCGATANDHLIPVDFVIDAEGEDALIDLMTIENHPYPALATSLAYDGTEKHAPAESGLVLTDTVGFVGLEVGATYELRGELHVVEADGSDGGVVATARREFKPERESDSTSLDFEFDATELGGRSLVAFERLYLAEELIALHEDLSDQGQTVYFPTICTTLRDETGTPGSGSDDEGAGTGGDSPDGTGGANGADGSGTVGSGTGGSGDATKEGTSGDDFGGGAGADNASDNSDDSGDATGDGAGGAGSGEGAGADAGNAPDNPDGAGDTNGTDGTGSDEGTGRPDSTDRVTLVDTVSYAGLIPGESYTLTGTLWDKATGTALEDEGGPLSATTSFVPEASAGTVEVVFEFEVSLVKGKTVVAFETLWQDERELIVHANLEDLAQTVVFEPEPESEEPTPDTPKPEEPKPTPEVPKPEEPTPETPVPELPRPETPKPEHPEPVTSKPDTPQPESPQAEESPTPEEEKQHENPAPAPSPKPSHGATPHTGDEVGLWAMGLVSAFVALCLGVLLRRHPLD